MDRIREDPKLGIAGQVVSETLHWVDRGSHVPMGEAVKGRLEFFGIWSPLPEAMFPWRKHRGAAGGRSLARGTRSAPEHPTGLQLRGGPSSLEGAPLSVLFCCFALFHWS